MSVLPGLRIANPDMDDWAVPSPSARTFDLTTLESTIEYTRIRDQPPAGPRRRCRDKIMRGVGFVAAGVILPPLLITVGVPYLAAKGARGVYHAANDKLKQIAAEQAQGNAPRSSQATFAAGVSTRDFANQPATGPSASQARPVAGPRSFVHHNLGDDEGYVMRLEMMQERSVLISQGKAARSNSILHQTAPRMGVGRSQTV